MLPKPTSTPTSCTVSATRARYRSEARTTRAPSVSTSCARWDVDLERPARCRRHERDPVLVGGDHAAAIGQFGGDEIVVQRPSGPRPLAGSDLALTRAGRPRLPVRGGRGFSCARSAVAARMSTIPAGDAPVAAPHQVGQHREPSPDAAGLAALGPVQGLRRAAPCLPVREDRLGHWRTGRSFPGALRCGRSARRSSRI